MRESFMGELGAERKVQRGKEFKGGRDESRTPCTSCLERLLRGRKAGKKNGRRGKKPLGS